MSWLSSWVGRLNWCRMESGSPEMQVIHTTTIITDKQLHSSYHFKNGFAMGVKLRGREMTGAKMVLSEQQARGRGGGDRRGGGGGEMQTGLPFIGQANFVDYTIYSIEFPP